MSGSVKSLIWWSNCTGWCMQFQGDAFRSKFMMNLYCIYEKVGNTAAVVFRKVHLLANCRGFIVILPESVYRRLFAALDTRKTSQDRVVWGQDTRPVCLQWTNSSIGGPRLVYRCAGLASGWTCQFVALCCWVVIVDIASMSTGDTHSISPTQALDAEFSCIVCSVRPIREPAPLL